MKCSLWLLRGPLATAVFLASAGALAEVQIDGELNEPEWERAQVFTDFRVTQPYTLGAPRYPTEARLLGTPQGIVVGFRCTHPPQTPRQLAQTPRDADNNGDRVNIYIDFNADAQVAYNITIALAGSPRFAAMNTIEPQVQNLAAIDLFYAQEDWAKARRPGAVEAVQQRLQALATWLGGRSYLEDRFTAADLLMVTVLRILRHTNIVAQIPVLENYRLRCEARPAFQRALAAQMAVFERHAA